MYKIFWGQKKKVIPGGGFGYVLVSGSWKAVTTAYVCVSGVWKEVTTLFVCSSATWKEGA